MVFCWNKSMSNLCCFPYYYSGQMIILSVYGSSYDHNIKHRNTDLYDKNFEYLQTALIYRTDLLSMIEEYLKFFLIRQTKNTALNYRLSLKYWVDAKVSADFFSFLCFKFLLKQNTINQQRIYHCYL